eukprot:1195761-Prorocentrum_minimum.AAC.6
MGESETKRRPHQGPAISNPWRVARTHPPSPNVPKVNAFRSVTHEFPPLGTRHLTQFSPSR